MSRSWQRLCAYVGQVLIGWNIDEFEGSLSVFFAHFVVVRTVVFCSIIDLVAFGDGDGTGVVTTESAGDGHLELEVGESFPDPKELPACEGEGDVFGLGGRSGNDVLLP